MVFIICEFNPFHRGHEYLLRCARERFPDNRIVCVMSGSFCQRGEACVSDKYVRARCAAACGADIVLLLPAIYATAPGRDFARGAVKICNAFAKDGDILFFGSEIGDISVLDTVRRRLDSIPFTPSLSGSESFAARQSRLYREKYGDDGIMQLSNNILGMEYLRALAETHSVLTPVTLKRDMSFESASVIRGKDSSSFLSSLPNVCADILGNDPYLGADMRHGERYIIGKLREKSGCEHISECGGGVGERILSAARSATSYAELIELAKTKKYPDGRIKRAVLALLMDITVSERQSDPTFTALLAGRECGTDILRDAKIEVAVKPSRCENAGFIRECEFDDLYSLLSVPMRAKGAWARSEIEILKRGTK